MKVKQSVILALIGIVLTLITRIGMFFQASINGLFILNFVNLLGCTLTTVFFIVFFISQEKKTELKRTGVIGMIGQVLYLIPITLTTISGKLFTRYVADFSKPERVFYIATIINQFSFILSIVSIILLAIFFMKLYKHLDSNSLFKKASLFASIGQIISLAWVILERILRISIFLIPSSLSGSMSVRNVRLGISRADDIIGIIAVMVLMFFFITLYRFQWQREDMQQVKDI